MPALRSFWPRVPRPSAMLAALLMASTAIAASPDRAPLRRDVDVFFDGVAKMDAALPRAAIDVEALANTAQRDAKKLCAWVDVHTRWIPYSGALKGAEGVLLERRGNSLDRALLLAALLEASGYAPQLAHANLPEKFAAQVVEHARKPLPAEPSLDALHRHEGELSRALKTVRTDGETKFDPAAERVGPPTIRAQAEWIVAQVQRAGVAIPAQAPDLIASARDHWWVRIDAAAGPIDLDPDARELPGGRFDVDSDSIVAARELSPETRQSVTVKIVVERWTEGALTENEAASAEIVLGNDALPSVVVEHYGPDWSEQALPREPADVATLAARTDRWQPIVRTEAGAVLGRVFDATGSLVEEADASAAGAGAAAGGLLGGFGGGEPAPKTDGVLTAEWIDFRVRVPGGGERTIRREIFDLLGPARRRQTLTAKPKISAERWQEARARLSGTLGVRLLNCRPQPVYFHHQLFMWMLAHRDAWTAFAANPQPGTDEKREFVTALQPFDPLLMFALFRGTVGDTTTFETGPMIVSCLEYITRPGGKTTQHRVFDVADNPTSSLAGDFAAVVRQGVADTAAEFYALGSAPAASRNLFAQVALSGSPADTASVLTGASSGGVELESVSDDARARIDAAIEGGYALLLPADRTPTKDPWRFGWWRIDRESGACIGAMASGYNAALTERAIAEERYSIFMRAVRTAIKNGDKEFIRQIGMSAGHHFYLQMVAPGEWSVQVLRAFAEIVNQLTFLL